jgi:electron transfer flavoprotein alpha subunit
MIRIFAYIIHKDGVVDDTAAELLAAAKRIGASSAPTAIVTGSGAELDAACKTLQDSYCEIWKVSNEAVAYPNAELVRKALVAIIPPGSIVLLPHSYFGIDLGPGLAVKLNSPCVTDVLAIEGVAGNYLKVVRQEFGGQMSTHVQCDLSSGAVVSLRPGAFKPVAAAPVRGTVVDKSSSVGALSAGRRYLETVVAESGDVDISKEAVLVSIGRGIQKEDNVHIAQELADTMGAALSCSRPVVDAKWLPKSRQVGSSGHTVKPKVYLACGISGSFQHLAGLKGNPFIVAINKNPKAPIFQVADVGIVDDILEFLPELTRKIRETVRVK